MRKKGKILTYTESNLASIHPSDIDRRAPSSQLIAELTLFVENDDSLREPRRDLECERDGETCDEGADERCPPVSLGASRTNDGSNLLKHPAVDVVVHVDRDVLPVLVLGRNDVHGPEHQSERNEHRVVRDVPPDAYPLPKAVHDVALVLGVWRPRRERRAVRSQVPRRVEQRRVLAVDL